MKHRHIVERNEENSSSPESGRRINNENLNWGKSGNENFSNINWNLRDKFHQENERDKKENLRHWGSNRKKNNSLINENVKSKNFWHKTSMKSGTLWKDQNLKVTGIEDREETQVKCAENILTKL